MFQTILNIVRNWLFSDQIRISPSCGRLLNLTLGSRIWLLDKVWRVIQIESRSGRSRDWNVKRVYHLAEDLGDHSLLTVACAELIVLASYASKMEIQAQLFWDDNHYYVFSDDIVVLENTSERECMTNS